jgi:hypothetical protein
MPYILQLPSGVMGQTLEQAYAGKGVHRSWRDRHAVRQFSKSDDSSPCGKNHQNVGKGDDVKQETALDAGTAIATFVNGAYPQNATGHAAVYLTQDDLGIQVLDQWASQGKVLKTHVSLDSVEVR